MQEQGCPYHGPKAKESNQTAIQTVKDAISDPDFVCIFGKAALRQEKIQFHAVEQEMDSPKAAAQTCQILYAYIEEVLHNIDFSQQKLPLASCVVTFPSQQLENEAEACKTVTQLLVAMHTYDVEQGYSWSGDVSNDPQSDTFSFSIGGEAFFVPLLYEHAHSFPRKIPVTALIFNWHTLFVELRNRNLFDKGREVIRKNTLALGHPIAELLADFGHDQEFPQYVLPSLENLPLLWAYLQEFGGDEPFGK